MRLVSGSSAVALLIAVAAMFHAPVAMAAQGSPTGTLSGNVSDSSGGVLPGVTVIAKHAQTGLAQQTTSGSEGDWRIPALPIGLYELTFELDGFKRLVRSGVIVEASATRTVPVTLEVGGLTETVNVTGDANLLATTTATTRSAMRR